MSINESTPAPKPPLYKRRWAQTTGLAFLAFVVGTNVGRTETVEVEVVKEVEVAGPTVEKKVEVEVTPTSCLTALDAGERGFTIAGESMGLVSGALNSVVAGDVDAVYESAASIQANSEALDPIAKEWNASKADCRSSAR